MSLFRRKRRQCKASQRSGSGYARVIEHCTRERGHDGPHANAFTQTAWVVKTFAQPVSYRWPYEYLSEDTTLAVEGLQAPRREAS